MKKLIFVFAVAGFVAITTAFTPLNGKLVSKIGHISFFSHTAVEDITANNYKVVSTIDPSSGEVVFSVPMQSFEFEKAKMQQHYNSPKFLDTKAYPKAKFKGNITNLGDIDFSKDGIYNVNVPIPTRHVVRVSHDFHMLNKRKQSNFALPPKPIIDF